MEGDLLRFSPSSSLSSESAAARDAPKRTESSAGADDDGGGLPRDRRHLTPNEELWTDDPSPEGNSPEFGEEQIGDSMTVTSSDREMLRLLNSNTELRRVNKELMKLSEEWDQVFHTMTLGLQHKLDGLELENAALKQMNSSLLLKLEHQQDRKEFYKRLLVQERKKSQELLDHVGLPECGAKAPECTPAKQKGVTSTAAHGHMLQGGGGGSGCGPSFLPAPKVHPQGKKKPEDARPPKAQLEALRFRTEIYEAEYQRERSDHKHTRQENRRLRRKKEEMCQQVALLQEQLKIYEDDFRRERSDKQLLQRLLQKKTPPCKDPVLVHRCNTERQPPGGDKRSRSVGRDGPRRKHHGPLGQQNSNQGKESA